MHAALAFTLFPLLLTQIAAAEVCICPDAPAEVRAAEADYLYELLALGTGDLCDGNIYREGEKPWLTQVKVLDARKGEASDAPLELLRHDEAPAFCGVKFTSGKR